MLFRNFLHVYSAHFNIVIIISYPVAIMKKFVQLMEYFNWLRSLWQQANISWHSPFLRKMVALFTHIGEWEKQKKSMHLHLQNI